MTPPRVASGDDPGAPPSAPVHPVPGDVVARLQHLTEQVLTAAPGTRPEHRAHLEHAVREAVGVGAETRLMSLLTTGDTAGRSDGVDLALAAVFEHVAQDTAHRWTPHMIEQAAASSGASWPVAVYARAQQIQKSRGWR